MVARSNDRFYDRKTAQAADAKIRLIKEDFVSGRANLAHGRFAGIVMAPAGAGKSYLGATVVATAVAATDSAPASVVVATPTNEQAYNFVDAFARRFRTLDIAFVPAEGRALPEKTAKLQNTFQIPASQAVDYPVVVGTLDKLGDANARGDLPEFSYLVIDEAFQADGAKYFKVGALSNRHLLVGDYGQLEPFTTIQDPGRWRGLPEDPTQTAVSVLRRNHPGRAEYKLPITRRLPPSAIPVVSSFYPDHDFEAWTRPGARQTRLAKRNGTRRVREVDKALDTVADHGWAWVQLPETPVITADPSTIRFIVETLRRMFERSAEVSDEVTRGTWRELVQRDVAVVVSHNAQKDYLRVALDEHGLREVVVDTANKMQGLQFELVVAWHPLAGLPDVDGFHLDPGRLCVMLTRHRHGCVVVGRESDPELVDDLPPAGEVWIGHDSDPLLDGWFAHRLVFDNLRDFSIQVSR